MIPSSRKAISKKKKLRRTNFSKSPEILDDEVVRVVTYLS